MDGREDQAAKIALQVGKVLNRKSAGKQREALMLTQSQLSAKRARREAARKVVREVKRQQWRDGKRSRNAGIRVDLSAPGMKS